MVNGFDTITRDTGDIAQSYEYMLDIEIPPVGGTGESTWQNVPELTGFNPVHTPVTQEATVYADQGANATRKTGSDFAASFNVLRKRDETGEFQASWLTLKAAADGEGEANLVTIRYYDSRGASDAYRVTCRVQRDARPETGAVGIGWDAFTLTGVRKATPIANPLKTV